jgi:hypothetical protein
MSESAESLKFGPPLGLPVGSVRALLTLQVVVVVTISVAQARDLDILWVETLLIALAHYFTSRRFVALPPDVMARIQNEGLIDRETHPLFLPRHSIRFLILATFGGLGFYLYREGRLFEPRSVSLLGIVAAYALGAVMRGVTSFLRRNRKHPPSRAWGDLRAIVVLLTVLTAVVPELLGTADALPQEVHRVALGLMLFYFGSR